MPYRDKEEQREYQRAWAAARRGAFFSGKTCVFCGSPDRLELDHIDPLEKKYPASRLWTLAEDNTNRINEIAKCQILCYDCHKEKTIREMTEVYGILTYQHGSNKMYRRGCKCDLCRAGNAKRKRERCARAKLNRGV